MRARAGVILSLAALMLCACGLDEPEDRRTRHWSKATIAPAEFRFWREDRASISLPAEKEAFLEFVRSRGGSYYIPGEGTAEALSRPPAPWPGSPCSETPDGIVVSLDSPNPREAAGFVAYVSDGKVLCVEPQFGYSTSPF